MSAYPQGASRAPASRAPRSGQLPYSLDVLGTQYRLVAATPAPGSDASRAFDLALPDGTSYVAEDCGDYQCCDCSAYLDGGSGSCPHLDALRRDGLFPRPSGFWAGWMVEHAGAEGGRR
jgi:hypothetical protein